MIKASKGKNTRNRRLRQTLETNSAAKLVRDTMNADPRFQGLHPIKPTDIPKPPDGPPAPTFHTPFS